MATLRYYLNADRTLARVILLDGLPPEQIPTVDPGQTTRDVTRAFPDARAEQWDPNAGGGAGDFVPVTPDAPPNQSMSKDAWFRRFTAAEQLNLVRLRRGRDPVTRAALSDDDAEKALVVFALLDNASTITPQIGGAPNPRMVALLTPLVTLNAITSVRRAALLAAVGSVSSDTDP